MKILKFYTKYTWKSHKKIPKDNLVELECACGLKFDIIKTVDRIEYPFCERIGSYNRMVSNIGRRDVG